MALEFHEPRDQLPPMAIEQHRVIASLIEELEAVAWYNQRAQASGDPEVKAVVEHNRNEEIEHACMLLEWLRRNFPPFEEMLKTYLFTSAPITQIEEAEAGGESGPEESTGETGSAGSLNIGSLK